jgi:hypothetical protein
MSPHNHVDALISRWSERLLVEGYCIIPDLLPRATVEALDADLKRDFEATPFCEGGFYGARTKRFGRLLTRSPHAASLVQHELVIGIVERILAPWCDVIQLNLTQATAVHPGSLPQVPHRDQDMWRGATGEIEYLVNVTCLETCAAAFSRKRPGHARRPPGQETGPFSQARFSRLGAAWQRNASLGRATGSASIEPAPAGTPGRAGFIAGDRLSHSARRRRGRTPDIGLLRPGANPASHARARLLGRAHEPPPTDTSPARRGPCTSCAGAVRSDCGAHSRVPPPARARPA